MDQLLPVRSCILENKADNFRVLHRNTVLLAGPFHPRGIPSCAVDRVPATSPCVGNEVLELFFGEYFVGHPSPHMPMNLDMLKPCHRPQIRRIVRVGDVPSIEVVQMHRASIPDWGVPPPHERQVIRSPTPRVEVGLVHPVPTMYGPPAGIVPGMR